MSTASDFSCAGGVEGIPLALPCRMPCPSPREMLLLQALTCFKTYKDAQLPSTRRVAPSHSETTKSCHGGLNTYFPGESAISPAQPLADDLEDELPGPSTPPRLARSMASTGTQPFCQRPEALLPRCLRGAHPRFFM